MSVRAPARTSTRPERHSAGRLPLAVFRCATIATITPSNKGLAMSGDPVAKPLWTGLPTGGGKACRVHRFGGPEVISFDEMGPLHPGGGEVLVRVAAAGVGPWDGWIRAGRSAMPQPLPLTLGSTSRAWWSRSAPACRRSPGRRGVRRDQRALHRQLRRLRDRLRDDDRSQAGRARRRRGRRRARYRGHRLAGPVPTEAALRRGQTVLIH